MYKACMTIFNEGAYLTFKSRSNTFLEPTVLSNKGLSQGNNGAFDRARTHDLHATLYSIIDCYKLGGGVVQ